VHIGKERHFLCIFQIVICCGSVLVASMPVQYLLTQWQWEIFVGYFELPPLSVVCCSCAGVLCQTFLAEEKKEGKKEVRSNCRPLPDSFVWRKNGEEADQEQTRFLQNSQHTKGYQTWVKIFLSARYSLKMKRWQFAFATENFDHKSNT
jgi:hypothetical protein